MESSQVKDRRALQRRSVALLSTAQVFSGVATGAVVSTGSLLAVELSGSEAWAGSVTTTMTLGSAVAAALLSRLALARGRRPALATGLLVGAAGAVGVIVAAVTGAFPLLVVAGALIGFGVAVNLQSRFAATDLSDPKHRGRDLSLVVWMSTIGAVAGPNLIGVGDGIAGGLGIPALSGLFVISAAGMLVAMTVIAVGLRPDPYLVSAGRQSLAGGALPDASAGGQRRPGLRAGLGIILREPRARTAFIGIVSAHAAMVAVMSMTPVHLTHYGASITIVGFTVSLHIAGMYALAPLMGILADRWGPRPVIASGLGAIVAATLTAGLSGSSQLATMIGLVLLGLGWSATTVAGSAMLVAAVPGEARPSVQGASDSLMSLAGAGGGAVAGLVLAAASYAGLGIAAAVLAAAALTVVLLTRGSSRVGKIPAGV